MITGPITGPVTSYFKDNVAHNIEQLPSVKWVHCYPGKQRQYPRHQKYFDHQSRSSYKKSDPFYNILVHDLHSHPLLLRHGPLNNNP